ncbi:unnamed protein product [Alopecurus aequalis]
MVPGIAPKPAVPLMAAQPKKPGHMLVLGTGFVGRYVSERLLAQGWRVSGTCTSAAKKMELKKLGMDVSVFDATRSNLANLHAVQDATHLLISIPPIPGVGDPLLSSHADLQRTVTNSNLQWLCYLSSTSVYGDYGGAWVNEDHVVNPKSESSKLRYAAEEGWLDLADELDLSTFVLRLGGIYGPGRRKIYNVVDDDSAPRAEVFAFAQSLIEKIYPDLATDSAGPDSQDRIIAAEKRVSNARLKEELGVSLVHPSYRSGLQSILDSWLAESTISRKMDDV